MFIGNILFEKHPMTPFRFKNPVILPVRALFAQEKNGKFSRKRRSSLLAFWQQVTTICSACCIECNTAKTL